MTQFLSFPPLKFSYDEKSYQFRKYLAGNFVADLRIQNQNGHQIFMDRSNILPEPRNDLQLIYFHVQISFAVSYNIISGIHTFRP